MKKMSPDFEDTISCTCTFVHICSTLIISSNPFIKSLLLVSMNNENRKCSAKHARPERSYWMFLLVGELYPLSKEAPTKRGAINHAR